MKVVPNRLGADGDHRLKGDEIDRRHGFTFRLDGRDIPGLPGDTLLTAALASGVIGAGTHDGQPLALDERFAPPVLLRGTMHELTRALPMERTPAAAALDLVTLPYALKGRVGQRVEALRAVLPGRRRRMGLSYDDRTAPTDPWFDAVPERQLEADVVVVGGGLAGLSAALSAGKWGEKVMLVERRQWLGGDVRFFGSTGDEDSPNEVVGRLTAALKSLPNVTILPRTEAFALFEGSVRINQVTLETGVPTSRVLTVAAPRIVLACGTIERLPIFAGNRLPGVVGARAAFHRADRFGVWIGQRALLSTATSVAYRVATLAKDAGIAVERIADTRLEPQSRFVEFGKAYGIPLARSVAPQRAELAGRRGGLTVQLNHIVEGGGRQAEQFAVDQLVVASGGQPDLSLWHMAGGGSRWDADSQRLEAEGSLAGIVLAGAVAGYRNASACIASGQAAIARLFGRPAPEVDDLQIDAMFESPDSPTPIGMLDPDAAAGAYLDGGSSLALRPARRAPTRKRSLRRQARWGFADEARALGVADVAAGVQLGVIPPDEAAIVAQERCVTPGDIVDAGRTRPIAMQPAAPATTPPAYLAGRFGPKTSVWVVEAADGRDFDIGCLVHADADRTDPAVALGVVFAPAPAGRKGGLAVMGKWPIAEGEALVVRDISAAVPVKLIDPLRPVEAPVVVKPLAATGTPPSPAVPDAPPPSAEAAIAMIAGAAHAVPAAAQPAADAPVAEAAAACDPTPSFAPVLSPPPASEPPPPEATTAQVVVSAGAGYGDGDGVAPDQAAPPPEAPIPRVETATIDAAPATDAAPSPSPVPAPAVHVEGPAVGSNGGEGDVPSEEAAPANQASMSIDEAATEPEAASPSA